MSTPLDSLAPKALWQHFAALNAVPRPSKKEERVIKFMQDFGNSQGFDTVTDKVGNVIIRKPASKGMENRQTVVLQSHLDMVHQKNADTEFDFNSQGIDMYVDGDWVKAKGTTAKLEYVRNKARDLIRRGKKILIFSGHRETVEQLALLLDGILPGKEAGYIHGAVKMDYRFELMNRFQNP
ncbi:MAG: hypothetical protein ACO1OQ_16200, partial [Rufibacter sp.]